MQNALAIELKPNGLAEGQSKPCILGSTGVQ